MLEVQKLAAKFAARHKNQDEAELNQNRRSPEKIRTFATKVLPTAVQCDYCKRFCQSESALVVHRDVHPTEVLAKQLFLGDENNAHSEQDLKQCGIKRVVNVAIDVEAQPQAAGANVELKYLHLKLHDNESQQLKEHFPTVLRFVDEAIAASEPVLIHCQKGISRSASFVVAYLMHSHKWSLKQSYDFLTSKRQIVNPNRGFQVQLGQFELALFPYLKEPTRKMKVFAKPALALTPAATPLATRAAPTDVWGPDFVVFTKRFGLRGEAVADALATFTTFSLDIVGIVASYLVCGTATSKAEPTLLRTFGSESLSSGCFAIASDSNYGSPIWVSSVPHVAVFDCDGKLHFSLGHYGSLYAMAMVNGCVFAASNAHNHVLVLDHKNGALLHTLGEHGTPSAGRLSQPTKLAASANYVYVVDDCSALCVVDRNGRHPMRRLVDDFGLPVYPQCLAVGPDRNLYVKRANSKQILVFESLSHKVVRVVDAQTAAYADNSQMCITRAGNIVVSMGDSGVAILTPEGQLITEFVHVASGLLCIHVDGDDRLFVGDYHGKVRVFGFPA